MWPNGKAAPCSGDVCRFESRHRSVNEWKSSGRMRSLPRKQVRARCPLWVRVPRLPLDSVARAARLRILRRDDAGGLPTLRIATGSWSNRKTSVLQTEDSGATPDESTLDLIPWSSGDDFWPTPRQRWFESIRDHWHLRFAIADLRLVLTSTQPDQSQISNRQSQIITAR